MNASVCAPVLEKAIRCRVAASAVLSGSAEEIAQWRQQPIVVGAEKLPISFLKHSDDQTVLAVRAVLQAIEHQGWQKRSFTNWGVIAAPNLFGRIANALAIRRYQQEGAFGVAPNMIPHLSLHAVSGTISQLFKIHGPNFGVGGAANASPDAFLIAGAMLMDQQLPGLWVILSGYANEWIPGIDGQIPAAPACQCVALALTATDAQMDGLHLTIGIDGDGENEPTEFSLSAFMDAWMTGSWRLAGDYRLEMEPAFPDAEGRS